MKEERKGASGEERVEEGKMKEERKGASGEEREWKGGEDLAECAGKPPSSRYIGGYTRWNHQ